MYNGCYTTNTVPGNADCHRLGRSCGGDQQLLLLGERQQQGLQHVDTYTSHLAGANAALPRKATARERGWTGCVTDRTQNYDTMNTTPSDHDRARFPANQYLREQRTYCDPQQSRPCSRSCPELHWTTRSATNAMQPTGGTNQADRAGLGDGIR